MKIAFRTDASEQIKTGHVMRCLTLADFLKKNGAEIIFIMRELPGHLIDRAQQRGFQVRHFKSDENISWEIDAQQTSNLLTHDCDCLIVDHYHLDQTWERAMRPRTRFIMAIDDLADRPHDCDILLDQNLHSNPQARYQSLIPKNCHTFFGPSYALLRPEFYQERSSLRKRTGDLKNILVSFGGGSQIEILEKTLQAIRDLKTFSFDIVSGICGSEYETLKKICEPLSHVTLHSDTQNMASLMSRADLALGAGGTTTWERCFLGLPSLIVVLAQNQLEIAQAADSANIAVNLGWHHEIDADKIKEAVLSLHHQPEKLTHMSQKAFDIMPSLENPLIASLMEILA